MDTCSLEEIESLLPSHALAILLLKHFNHVFLEEIPLGLPPKRDIQHHSDLIPAAVLPNKLVYRLNPKDTWEI